MSLNKYRRGLVWISSGSFPTLGYGHHVVGPELDGARDSEISLTEDSMARVDTVWLDANHEAKQSKPPAASKAWLSPSEQLGVALNLLIRP